MERVVWRGKIKPGCKGEYIRRHDEIWPELLEVFKKSGICNYTIFACGEELFGYYECEKGIEYAKNVRAKEPVTEKWNAYMQDILELQSDSGSAFEPVFRWD